MNREDSLAKAFAASQELRQCSHCERMFTTGGHAVHVIACLHADANTRRCIQCNERIYNPHNRFCNRSCSAKFNNKNRSSESRAKQAASVSQTMKRKSKGLDMEARQCATCNVIFLHPRYKKKKTCSIDCQSLLAGLNASHNNHVWSRRKSIPYYCAHMNENIILQSSWELTIAKHLDDLGLKWSRPQSIIWVDQQGKKRRYFPDFYLIDHDLYIDPKNPRVLSKDQAKIEAATKQIKLIVGNPDEIIHELSLLIY